jgi:galactonate dehydratase
MELTIERLETQVVHVNRRGDWVFCLIHTNEGITGLGEASHSLNDALVISALEQYGRRLVGQDPQRIEAIWASLNNRHGGRVEHTALSAIEQALWDILGQHLGVPIRVLLGGGVRDRVRLYANINRHVVNRSADGFAAAARQAVAEGFTAVKLAPFDEVCGPAHIRTGPRAAWLPGVERVRAVREAIGPEIELAVDCHGRFDVAEALTAARALEECDLFWLEEPVPHTCTDDLARITSAVPMATASAESVYAVEGFAPFITRRVVDVIMPDVKHDGGVMETKRIAGAARASGLLVAPHNPAGPVSTAATAQVASTLSNFLILEYAWGEADWRADLLQPAERIEGGHLILPQGPGLGHRLNPDVVTAHRVEGHRAR